ncbi:hypothetical protein RFN28_08745 [Mesorhizobium sp. VK24D]|uniref:DUF1127 domain-containing protein n=1 Tax=Mesorhizobium album TaxID=3072314 RepID=A0ABU4XY64_9HYPH|nr:hypothetical protein [Mesorhizobium sp. VK24D]MDX8478569.1 hypothetical protein [Mesorhizobium sp. VK24D]
MTPMQEKLVSNPVRGWISLLAREFSWLASRRRGYVDVRELSEHLQRDMGFLDGNDPHGRYK